MFGKLKNKLKNWTEKISEEAEEQEEIVEEEETIEEPKEEKAEKKSFLKKIFSKKEKTPDNYFIYKFSGRTPEEVESTIEELENEYGKGFFYCRDLQEEGESREQIIEKFKEKIKDFSTENPEMKFIIDYSNGFGRLMKMELEEAKKYGFEIIELHKPGTKKCPSGFEIEKKIKKDLEENEYPEAEKVFELGTTTYATNIKKTIEKLKENKEESEKKSKEKKTKEVPKEIKEEVIEEKEETSEEPKEEKVEKKSFLKKIISKKIKLSEEDFEKYSEDLEFLLLENNVAMEVVDKIVEKLKEKITNQEINKKELEEKIKEGLKEIIEEVLIEPFDIIKEIKEKDSPYVILFCGINGTGKTTTIAKFAHLLKKEKLSCIFAAGDTFRAASIEQIKKHGENLEVPVISHDYNSDPAAVGFDAIKYAEKNKVDCVLIDTAGRMYTDKNLMSQIQKIVRVTKPDKKIFLGEAIAGNDSVEQVKAFNEAIEVDGIILSKADIDEKGGTALSLGYITNKPVLYLGTGQEYEKLEKFDKEKFIEKLEL